jgi:hypothetical protein
MFGVLGCAAAAARNGVTKFDAAPFNGLLCSQLAAGNPELQFVTNFVNQNAGR